MDDDAIVVTEEMIEAGWKAYTQSYRAGLSLGASKVAHFRAMLKLWLAMPEQRAVLDVIEGRGQTEALTDTTDHLNFCRLRALELAVECGAGRGMLDGERSVVALAERFFAFLTGSPPESMQVQGAAAGVSAAAVSTWPFI